jgi:hypothetical protein
MFDYICSLATHGFYYMKQKRFYSSRFSGCIFGDCNLAAKRSDSWRGYSEQPEKIWIKAINAQKKNILQSHYKIASVLCKNF